MVTLAAAGSGDNSNAEVDGTANPQQHLLQSSGQDAGGAKTSIAQPFLDNWKTTLG